MSNTLLNLVWPLELSPTQKLVLVALADAAREPDDVQRPSQCWPPINGQDGKLGLVQRTCLSDRAIQKAIQALVQAGHITRLERPGHGVIYSVHPRATFAPNEVRPEQEAGTPEGGSGKSLEIQKKKKKKGEAVQIEVPEWMPSREWLAFVEMRHEIPGVPFTAFAANEIVRKLSGLRDRGDDIRKVLTNCVVRGYRDVLEPGAATNQLKLPIQPSRGTGGQLPARNSVASDRTDDERPAATAKRSPTSAKSIGSILKRGGYTTGTGSEPHIPFSGSPRT